MEREGVIKFDLRHQSDTARVRRYPELAAQVVAWRDVLTRLSLVGQDPGRYQGLGFGNVSTRVPPWGLGPGKRGFLITGTQTGGQVCMSETQLALVRRYDVRRGRIDSEGAVRPSSEALTHAAIYDQAPHVRWVFHVHSPAIWQRARSGGVLPMTREGVEYGTVEMANEIRRLWRSTQLCEGRVLVMAGHEDGVVSFGRTASEAGSVVLEQLAASFADLFAAEGELCRTRL